MKNAGRITTLFLDIGGVLLSNGWDHRARQRAVAHFRLDGPEMESRHQICFSAHEVGRLSLREYLDLVVFHQKRRFSRAQFRDFMRAQSTPMPRMLDLAARLKSRHGFKIVALSNEGRELNAYRIKRFKLGALVDFFVSSCFVRMRKPDPAIFRLALDLAQTPPGQGLYIENTPLFCQIAGNLGIRSVVHRNYARTFAELETLGLSPGRGSGHGR